MKEPTNEATRQLLRTLGGIAESCRATLVKPESLFPANLEFNGVSEFKHGMAAVVLQVFFLIGKTPEGRQAILDLGFKPLLDDVECPPGVAPSGPEAIIPLRRNTAEVAAASLDRALHQVRSVPDASFKANAVDLAQVETRQPQASELPKKLLRGSVEQQENFFTRCLSAGGGPWMTVREQRARKARSRLRRLGRNSKVLLALVLTVLRNTSRRHRAAR